MTPDKPILGLRVKNFFEEYRQKAETYECVVCKMIFSNNFNLECNHCICEYCIKKKRYEKCPKDGHEIINFINAFNDSFIGDEILGDLKVKCIFEDKGCQWSGIFDEFYSKHLNECKFNIYKENNNKNDDYDIIIDGENDENIINNNEKYMDESILNRKRKLKKENKQKVKIRNNSEKKHIRNTLFDSKFSNFSIFQQTNIFNNINLLPQEDKNINKNLNYNEKENIINDNGIILDKYFFEDYNNNIIIDSNLTKNQFPYNYYFTAPLDNTFNCQIEVISRDIKNNDEISFGLTNLNNNEYIEIISTKDNIFLFIFQNIIRIFYDSDTFYINNEHGNFNREIVFVKDENIRYYPTIILNNQFDKLKVSHN